MKKNNKGGFQNPLTPIIKKIKAMPRQDLIKYGAIVLVGLFVLVIAVRIGIKIVQGAKKGTPVVFTVGAMPLKKEMINQVLSFQGILEGDPQVKVYPSVSGKFQGNAVKEGQYVQANQDMVFINRDIIGSDYRPAPVKSPIAGMVTRLYYIDRGAALSPDRPVAEVANIQDVKVVLNVGEEDLIKVKANQPAKISSIHDPARFLNASVYSVTPFIDRDTLSGSITVRSPNITNTLSLGMSVDIDITIGQKEAFMVPEEAVIMGLDKVYVFVDNGGKAKQVDVKLGYRQETRIEVVGELNEGDQIITDGSFKLSDGAKITIAARQD